MRTLTIKNIPQELYGRLKASAKAHRRSLNGEVIFHLDRALRAKRADAEILLKRIAAIQRDLELPPLANKVLRKAKEEGRS